MTKGLDLSKHNKGIDFNAIKKKGYTFVILRVGYSGWLNGQLVKDEMFETYYKEAKRVGLNVGVYFFSQAINIAEAEAEARFTLEQIKNKDIDYPVYIDTELSGASGNVGRADKLNKTTRTNVVKRFCDIIEQHKYYAGIYCSESWLANNLNYNALTPYDKWIAKWSVMKPTLRYGNYGMWQNSNNGRIGNKRVDTNICYKDYPSIIRKAGLNNFKTVTKYDLFLENVKEENKEKIVDYLKSINQNYLIKKVGDSEWL